MGRGKKRPIPVTSQDDTSDGTVTSKRTKNLNSSCPICERAFEPGQESIFCDGDCQKFIHRQCASLTKHQFKQVGESDLPYFCVHCTLSNQNSEITNLKQVITELTDKINSLTPMKPVNVHSAVQLPVRMSTNPASQPPNTATTTVQPADRKFNLVVYGVSECPNGTSWPDRMKHDIDKSVSVLSKINNDINPNSVRDCLRLGKYNKEQYRSCPLLLKLNRAVDVISVLSNLGANQDKSVSIKPDMTPDEKQKEALLLKERWSLLQSGVNKADVKIRSGSIYVKGKKHGYASNLVFHLANASPPTMSVDSDSTDNASPLTVSVDSDSTDNASPLTMSVDSDSADNSN